MRYVARMSAGLVAVVAFGATSVAAGQQPIATANAKPATNTAVRAPVEPIAVPADYAIGAQDVLSIVFWRDKDMSGDVIVRPDGKISLPLLNDIQAAGYTPEQLRTNIQRAASKFIEEPNATVVVKEIHSRNVFITGVVNKPGAFPLIGEISVLQLIALAGGLQEYADSDSILVVRSEGGRQTHYKFNYKEVLKQKHVEQNIMLKPGDTVVVP